MGDETVIELAVVLCRVWLNASQTVGTLGTIVFQLLQRSYEAMYLTENMEHLMPHSFSRPMWRSRIVGLVHGVREIRVARRFQNKTKEEVISNVHHPPRKQQKSIEQKIKGEFCITIWLNERQFRFAIIISIICTGCHSDRGRSAPQTYITHSITHTTPIKTH